MTDESRGKVTKSVRLPADVAETVEQYAERQGVSESDALRRFLMMGATVSDDIEELTERVESLEETVETPWWRRW